MIYSGNQNNSEQDFSHLGEIMRASDNIKRIVIIAGPNGAGKTTFAREFLPTDADCPNFVNADLIAAGLSPFAPDLVAFKAGRLMLETIADFAKRGESFSFETTLSGLTYAQMIPTWQADGFRVTLIFLSLPNAEMALARVATRVIQGGHNVPEDVIRRRFAHGIKNLERYKVLVDNWQLYDNSGVPPILQEEG
jgi:predicted ABC-type ATPase